MLTPTPTSTPVPPTPTATEEPALTGDVNDDASVTSVDALLVLQYGANLLGALANLGNADVNADGTSIRSMLRSFYSTLLDRWRVCPDRDTAPIHGPDRHRSRARPGVGRMTLRRRVGDQPRRELQDDGSIDTRHVAVSVNVAELPTEQGSDESGS